MCSPLVIQRAHDMVSALCDGRRDWVMRVPADESHDPDLIIGGALQVANDLYAALSYLADWMENQSGICFCEGDQHEEGCYYGTAIVALAKARGEATA